MISIPSGRNLRLWEHARGPGSLGDPACGIPTLLDPMQAEEYREPGPLPRFEPGPPFRSGPPPPVGARNRYHLSFWRFFPCFIAFFGPM